MLKYNPELLKKKQKTQINKPKPENRTPSVQRRNKLLQLAMKNKRLLPDPQSFSGQGDTWQKTSTELKTKRNSTKHVVLHYIVNKLLPSGSASEAMGDSSQLALTKGHNFEASKMVSCLSIRADLEPHFHTFHSNMTSKCAAPKYIKIWSWQGNKVLPRGLNAVVMSYSEQQADLNWHHNIETPMSLCWKASTRAQLQTTFFYSSHEDRAAKEIHAGVPHFKKHTHELESI